VQDKWPKGCVVLVTEKAKHILALRLNPWAISPNFCEYTLWPFTYMPSFVQIRSGLRSYKRKTDPQTQK